MGAGSTARARIADRLPSLWSRQESPRGRFLVKHTPVPPPTPEALRVSILSPAEAEGQPGLRAEWQRRVDRSTNIYRLYQSPLWWDHLRATAGDDALKVAVVRDRDDAIRGVVPFELTRYRTTRQLGARVIPVFSAPGLEILGSQPLLDPGDELFDALFDAVWRAMPGIDLCRAKSVPTSSPLWHYMNDFEPPERSRLVVADGPHRPFYFIDLSAGWTGYLSRFTAKQRNDLQRKQRLLNEAGSGALTLRAIENEDTLVAVYPDLEEVARQARHRPGRELPPLPKLRDAAVRHLLRSYVLYAGSTAMAFVVGYQAFDMFHYSDVAYSEAFGRHSPGTVLLYQVIRDVCEKSPARWFNFGIGDAEYKRRFSNVRTEDAIVYVMRRTVRNRMRALRVRGFEVLSHLWQSYSRRERPKRLRA